MSSAIPQPVTPTIGASVNDLVRILHRCADLPEHAKLTIAAIIEAHCPSKGRDHE